MKTLPLSEAKAKLSQLVDAVAGRDEQITITRNGRPAAILVSPDEYESWEATIEILRDPDFVGSIRRGLRDLEAGRVLSEREIDELFDMGPGEASRARGAGRAKAKRASGRRR